MKSLFVGNISFKTTENELRAVFESFGDIERVRVITDQFTGRSRGFGFVDMANDDEAAKAIVAINGKEVDGRALNVSEAKPKPGRTGGTQMPAEQYGTYSRERFRTARY
jgi:cold-inducible RNA-binding protein